MSGIGAADAAIYTGVCLENNDPAGLGRVKYCVPQLSGTASFGWALPVYPGVTAIGANIYVAFEGGDRNRPVFWPDQIVPPPAPPPPYVPPPISYPTYAALTAAQPTATTPVGSQFYVADHGGNAQLQNTGIGTGVTWQWLPNGFQSGQSASYSSISATTASAFLLASTVFDNPSTKRNYRIQADAALVSANTSARRIQFAILISSTAPAATIPQSTSFNYYIFGVAPTSTIGLGTFNLNMLTTGLPTGVTYVASYVLNTDAGGGTVISAFSALQTLLVEDIGANT